MSNHPRQPVSAAGRQRCRWALLLLAFAGLAAGARADFSGPYAVTPPAAGTYGLSNGRFGDWTLDVMTSGFGGPASIVTSQSGVSFDTYYPISNGLGSYFSLTFLDVAADTGTFSFDYILSVGNGDDYAGYEVNGVFTRVPAGGASIMDVPLNAGDVFGFYAYAGRQSIVLGIISRTIFSVNNFSAPAPVPEASSKVWLGLGLACFGWQRLRRTGRAGRRSGS